MKQEQASRAAGDRGGTNWQLPTRGSWRRITHGTIQEKRVTEFRIRRLQDASGRANTYGHTTSAQLTCRPCASWWWTRNNTCAVVHRFAVPDYCRGIIGSSNSKSKHPCLARIESGAGVRRPVGACELY
jgi:hypothetical protein